jgi:hypothetical protein
METCDSGRKHSTFLTASLEGTYCQLYALSQGKSPPTPGAYWVEEWVDPGFGLGVMAKRKFPIFSGIQTPVFQLIASPFLPDLPWFLTISER